MYDVSNSVLNSAFLMTLSDFRGHLPTLKAFSNVIFRTALQQLTGCRAVPLRKLMFLFVAWEFFFYEYACISFL